MKSADDKHRQRSFFVVAVVNMVLLMTGVLATPLYHLYETQFSLAPVEVTLIYAAYAIAVVPVFFVFGPLGDRYGRKLALVVAVGLAMVSCFFFVFAGGFWWLVVGRALEGAAVGAAMGNATAALVELDPDGDRRRAGRVAGVSLFAGLVLGPLVAGSLVQYLGVGVDFVFVLDFVVLVGSLGLLALVKEPRRVRVPEPFRLRKPHVPAGVRRSFWSASLAVSLVFAMSSLYFSVAPIYTKTLLGLENVLLGGSVASIMVFVGMLSQRLFGGVRAWCLLVWGQLGLALGLLIIVGAQFVSSLWVLVLGAVVSGAAYGATFLGAVAVINAVAPENRRGDVTSSFYAVAYVALGVPIIGLGVAEQGLGLFFAVQLFVAAVVAVALLHVVWLVVWGRGVSD